MARVAANDTLGKVGEKILFGKTFLVVVATTIGVRREIFVCLADNRDSLDSLLDRQLNEIDTIFRDAVL